MALNFNDPLYAYNTQGYTNQNDGGAAGTLTQNIPQALTFGSGAGLVEPATLSGFVTRTIDSDVTTAGGAGSALTLVSQTVYLASVLVLETAKISTITINVAANGTQTHATAAIYNASTGGRMATVTDLTSGGLGQGGTGISALALASSVILTPGIYWIALASTNSTAVTLNAFTLSSETQTLLTSTGVLNYTVGLSKRWATGVTGLTTLDAMPAALTSSMTVSATAKGWFAGLS